LISVEGLTKHFYDSQRGTITAVDSIHFKCEPGEIYGLLGPNGAGKTTTLRMLATLLAPSDGSAVLNGYNIQEQPNQVRASLGFLSSTTGLYPRLTPREILAFFGKLHGLTPDEIKRRSDVLISDFGIDSYAGVLNRSNSDQ